MKIFYSCVVFMSLPIFWLSGQSDSTRRRVASEILSEANSLHDRGDYAGSLSLLSKISICDADYPVCCYEQALSYYNLDDNEMGLAKCREAIFLRYTEPEVYSLMGSIFDDMGQPDEGVRILRSVSHLWPYNQNLQYNLGLCLLNAGQLAEAEQVLLRSLLINPYHTRSHLVLGRVNYLMGRIAQAFMAYTLAVTMNPSVVNLQEFEHAISGQISGTPRPWLYPYPDGYNHAHWDKARDLLLAGMAFKEDFPFPEAVKYTVTRQAWLLMHNITHETGDTTLYNRYYTRMLAEIVRSGQAETFFYYFLKEAGNDEINTWVAQNDSKIDGFITWAKDFINNGRVTGFNVADHLSGIRRYGYGENGYLNAIGVTDGTGMKTGDWIILSNDGGLEEKGGYVNGSLQGKYQIFWPNGNIKQDLVFLNGKLHGHCQIYYSNGSTEGAYPFENGMRQGRVQTYARSGELISDYGYANNMLSGNGEFTDFNGPYRRTMHYRNDTLQGPFEETWLNGNSKLRCSYLNGLLNGPYLSFFPGGGTEIVADYSAGKRTGQYLKYNLNGKPAESAGYSDDKLHGVFSIFSRDGKLASEQNAYENGKLTGTYRDFYPDGKVQIERVYVGDTLRSMTCFDSKANRLYHAEPRGDSMHFKTYYGNGMVQLEGLLVGGLREGLWKSYNRFGTHTGTYGYKKGLTSGPQVTWHPNGLINEQYLCDSNDVVGEYRKYHANGSLESAGYYQKGGLQDEYLTYRPDGVIATRGFYSSGIRTGRFQTFGAEGRLVTEEFFDSDGGSLRLIVYDSSGTVAEDRDYAPGVATFTRNFSDGTLRSVHRIADSRLHGLQEEYHPNGQLASTSPFLYGKLHGTRKVFDHSGALSAEFEYLFGDLYGQAVWYKNGKKDFESVFENGQYQGIATSYFENGNKSRVLSFHNDLRNGYTEFFTPSGDLIIRILFEEDLPVAYTWKNATGGFVPEITVDSSTHRMLSYFSNGRVSASIELKKGMYHGSYLLYYPDGKLLRSARLDYGQDTGEEKFYYANGKPREVTHYLHDIRWGPYLEYYESGLLKLEGQYTGGAKTGIWRAYDHTGKLLEELEYYNDELVSIVAR